MKTKQTDTALVPVAPESWGDAEALIERYQRTLRLLIAGDFVTKEKVEQAWQIAKLN